MRGAAGVTRVAPVLFALLVAATFGALLAAQRLRHGPAVVRGLAATRVFSPNGDGRLEQAAVRFTVATPDTVAVAVVDDGGDRVRTLRRVTTHRAGEAVAATWDGRDEDGRRAPDGTYRVRLAFARQGRGLDDRRTVRLDTTAPRPLVTAASPRLLPVPGGGATTLAVRARGTALRVALYRTDPAPALVRTLDVPAPDRPGGRWAGPVAVRWDGTVGGRPAPAGTYVAVAEVRDAAGNLGRSAPLGPRALPLAPYGRSLPGRAGVTVRAVGVAPPAEPVTGGQVVTLGVDTRQRPYRWALRRVGSGRVEARGGHGAGAPALRVRAPSGPSGLHLLEVDAGGAVARVPVAVQAGGPQRVLVVLPVMTWQGRNRLDDDGDGEPDLLDRGRPVGVHRVLAGGALPAGVAGTTAPLLAWLDDTGRRYDLTTDVALAQGHGPRLEGHAGVLLAGDVRWLPAGLQRALRRFVTAGGTLAAAGTDDLRRQVRLTADDRLADPTPAAPASALGLRPGPLLRADTLTLTNLRDDLRLFAGSSGELRGFRVAEPLRGVQDGRVLSSAVTGDDETVVVAAVRSGRGLTIHLGLPELPGRLGGPTADPDAQALMGRTWALLSR